MARVMAAGGWANVGLYCYMVHLAPATAPIFTQVWPAIFAACLGLSILSLAVAATEIAVRP